MAWTVNLLKVEVFAETAIPDLHQERPIEVQDQLAGLAWLKKQLVTSSVTVVPAR